MLVCLFETVTGLVEVHDAKGLTDTEREREESRGERHKTARKTGHVDNPGEKKRMRGGERVEMVAGVEEVGNCWVGHVCVPSSVGLQQLSYA